MPKQDFRNEPTVLAAMLKVAPNSTASLREKLFGKASKNSFLFCLIKKLLTRKKYNYKSISKPQKSTSQTTSKVEMRRRCVVDAS